MRLIGTDSNYSNTAIVAVGLLLSLWLVFFISGLVLYQGSGATYALFSFVFLGMLMSGLVHQAGYGYLFLVVMLWLGFWLKVTVHLLLPYPFTEFTGRFVSNPEAWDKVLLAATIGAAGVLVARLVFIGFNLTVFSKNEMREKTPPSWYPASRTRLWVGLVICIAAIAILNVIYGFQQSGLVPRHILGWHLNGVVYYLLSVVFVICCATLIWWDVQLEKNISGVVYGIVFESMVSSISLLSRGTLIFHALPQIIALYKLKRRLIGYSWWKAAMLIMIFAISVVATYSVVNLLRSHYYSGVPLELSIDLFKEKGGDSIKEKGGDSIKEKGGDSVLQFAASGNSFLRFAIDRWIGVEGVMAVVSYPEKGAEQLLRGLTEQSEDGKVTMYQEVCLSHYRNMDAGKFRFANLPGAVGFFLYSGSLFLVFIGLAIFTITILMFERWVLSFTGNPILCAFVGGGLANTVCQFGVAPSNLAPYFFALIGSVIMVGVVQAKSGANTLRGQPKIRAH